MKENELLLWMEEKSKVAEDESYRDPTNVLRKLKRHEAAEKEMQANQEFLDRLVQVSYSCVDLLLELRDVNLNHVFMCVCSAGT